MTAGDFVLHLGPEGHERLRKAAAEAGVSMAQFLREGLEMRIGAGQPPQPSLDEALDLVARAARMLAAGPPAPLREAPGEHKETYWDALLRDGKP